MGKKKTPSRMGSGPEIVVDLGTKKFAESLQSRLEWLDKLKAQRKELNDEIKETEDGLRRAIDEAASAQESLPLGDE